MEPELRRAIGAILDEADTLTLATVELDGRPRATPLMFAADESLCPLFLSDPSTQHIRNLEHVSETAVAIYPPIDGWRMIRGLQLKGRTGMVPDGEYALAMEHYTRRFPFVSELEDAVAASRLYRFQPDWVRLIDNRQEFGFSQEAVWD
ncbi:MAG: pyridoxamine 5'-phosphate oxidase family protein [Anaerolineales bacterium]